MPVAKLKKITIVSTQSIKAEVIKELEGAGAVQITDFHMGPEASELGFFCHGGEVPLPEVDTINHQIQYCLEFIRDFSPPKKDRSLFSSPKNPVEYDKFLQIGYSFPYKGMFDECQRLDQGLIQLKNKENRINHLRERLNPWVSINIILEDTQELSGAEVFLILLNDNISWADFRRKVEEAAGEYCYLEQFELEKERKGGLVVISIERSSSIKQILKEHNIDTLEPLPDFKGSPREILKKLDHEQAEIEAERLTVREQAKSLLGSLPDLMIAYDYAQLLKVRKEINGYLGYTDQVLIIQGWITASEAVKLKDALSQKLKEVEILFRNPLPGEEPPILLSNPYPVKPFEQITKIYSLPNTQEFDPTPFVFPFFLLFFGICLSEAGYGIIISLVFYLALRKIRLGDNSREFFALLFLGGLSSLFFGALSGSWFGDLLDILPANISLKEFKDSLMIINPINNPIPLLIFCLFLGIVQIYTGLFLNLAISLKAKMVRESLLNEGVRIILLTAFILWVLGIANVISVSWKPIINWAFISSLLLVAITRWRGEQTLVSKLVAVIFGIYDLVGYLGDILSYSRLFALGLATGVIAIVVNTLILAIKDISGIAIILIPLIFCIGHLFNLILSTLGAFIHSLRLQYVEYFTKFYQGGGKPFEPYGIKTKYVEIIPSR